MNSVLVGGGGGGGGAFFFNDTATTEIYTLSLHDALPILLIVSIITSATSSVEYFKFPVPTAGKATLVTLWAEKPLIATAISFLKRCNTIDSRLAILSVAVMCGGLIPTHGQIHKSRMSLYKNL